MVDQVTATASLASMEAEVRRFNERYPVGTAICVWKGAMHDKPGLLTKVAEPGAYILSGHTPVVKIPGDCIALTHVAPVAGLRTQAEEVLNAALGQRQQNEIWRADPRLHNSVARGQEIAASLLQAASTLQWLADNEAWFVEQSAARQAALSTAAEKPAA
jgi:hypothetical protein